MHRTSFRFVAMFSCFFLFQNLNYGMYFLSFRKILEVRHDINKLEGSLRIEKERVRCSISRKFIEFEEQIKIKDQKLAESDNCFEELKRTCDMLAEKYHIIALR